CSGVAERCRWSQVGSTLRSSEKTVAGTSSRIANRIRIGSPPDELLRSELYQQRLPDGRKIRRARLRTCRFSTESSEPPVELVLHRPIESTNIFSSRRKKSCSQFSSRAIQSICKQLRRWMHRRDEGRRNV